MSGKRRKALAAALHSHTGRAATTPYSRKLKKLYTRSPSQNPVEREVQAAIEVSNAGRYIGSQI